MTRDFEPDSVVIAKLVEAQRWFECWRATSEFSNRYWTIRRLASPRIEFTRREAKWLLEAYLLLKFAKLKHLKRIRLNRNDPPDAYYADHHRVVPIEITEVLEPGRRRGNEYPDDEPRVEDDPVEDWFKRAGSIPGALSDGLNKKKRKKYAAETELLIYLNISEWGIEQTAIEHQIRYTLSLSTEPFSKIHILWKGKLFSSDGAISNDPDPFDNDVGDDAEIFQAAFDNSELKE